MPGIQRRGNDDVHFPGLLGEQGHFCGDEGLAHDPGVAAFAGTVFLKVQLQKLGPHALHLLFHHGASVEGFDDGSQTPGGHPMAASPATPAPITSTLAGGRFTGGGNLPGKAAPVLTGSFNNGPVAANVGHGTEGIELLGTGDAGERHPSPVRCCRDWPGGSSAPDFGPAR